MLLDSESSGLGLRPNQVSALGHLAWTLYSGRSHFTLQMTRWTWKPRFLRGAGSGHFLCGEDGQAPKGSLYMKI